MIAGHSFTAHPHGHACTNCGRTWLNLLDNRDRWVVGARDIACHGALVEREIAELQCELIRIWDSVVAGVEA